ncbi:GNAT family N-acetyltransferase [Oleidesulfovibrio alaskensis]|uniref:GNAT family N-acetyltransferase n=1 Tax=Oleidesulfovibrio alaskensis TaxID=58180 RepID=UPI000414169F|nr:GNAT family N-acetyltransferase [Oleidesulfovibrio alaskensis]
MHDSPFAVRLLADEPAFGPLALQWIYEQWGAAPGVTLEEARGRTARYAGRTTLPMMLLAFAAGTPAGCVVLRTGDCPARPELTPWLASLYVHPACRGRGAGTALVCAAQRNAARLGYSRLYLVTETAAPFYRRLGWATLEETPDTGEIIMYADLRQEAALGKR